MACRETKFALAGLGNDAGMYGAARLVQKEQNDVNYEFRQGV